MSPMIMTNQIAEHLCIGDMSPPAYIMYLSLTPLVESLQCIHVCDQEGLFFCALEQNRLSVLGTGVLWC